VVDSTIARGGETPVAWRSVCSCGRLATKDHCAERWGKGRYWGLIIEALGLLVDKFQ